MSAVKSVLRSTVAGIAFGGFLYLVGDTASDYLTFSRLRTAALDLVQQDSELQQLVGTPYTTGYWYNSTLGFSHKEKVAHCTFQLQGSRRVTDVAVKAGRQQGPKSNILYNIIGPGTWQLVSCQAMVPSEGGLVQPRSLLPEHRDEQQQQQHLQQHLQQVMQQHQPAGQKQQQQQLGQPGGQQQQQAAAGSRGWRLWPWGSSRSGSSGSSGNAAA
jgi:hypothetical protein